MILKIDEDQQGMGLSITFGALKAEINFAREMLTELVRCKARANELLGGELKQNVTNCLDMAIRESKVGLEKMEREARDSKVLNS
jgi:hypothetical protein